MTEFAASLPAQVARLRDLAALGKPRLSSLVLFTAAAGVWMGPDRMSAARTLAFLLATSALVAAANTLNCWVEREIDGRMDRTRERPLPAGRLDPRTAVVLGLALGAASLGVLAAGTGALTAALGATALFLYVLVYTPLKRVTPWAVVVGAIPGAIPPLMGWTAASGTIAVPGLMLFGILALWQLPHFIAISMYLADDFRRGGIRVVPVARGERSAARWLAVSSVVLVAFSFVPAALGVAGAAYVATAGLLGATWLALVARRGSLAAVAWARRLFGFSLLYLPILITVLVLDAR